jgi:hypothetical protein
VFDPREKIEAAKKLNIGKQVLLTAKSVYSRSIPSGEKTFLFQDGKILTLDYEYK